MARGEWVDWRMGGSWKDISNFEALDLKLCVLHAAQEWEERYWVAVCVVCEHEGRWGQALAPPASSSSVDPPSKATGDEPNS